MRAKSSRVAIPLGTIVRVETRSLGFAYPSETGSVVALSGLDLVVESGSFHAVVGPNGCGKSTLLRLVAGLAKPAAGTIELSGPQRHANAAALVFESPRLLPWWNVERNVAIGSAYRNIPHDVYERVKDLYTSLVGLAGLGKRLPGTLSMGEQTRAGIGRALAYDADVLLLDEPFAHLDAPTRSRFVEELERLWTLDRRTAILVTHDIDEAVTLADQVSVMRAGPGPLVATVDINVGRPRHRLPVTDPGLRAAARQVWEALQHSRK